MMPLPEVLLTADCESSGFGEDSYPVAIGIAGPRGDCRRWLIRPLPTWTHWDEISAELHGITRAELQERGADAHQVCGEINWNVGGETVYVDSDFDLSWINRLFSECEVEKLFTLRHIRDFLGVQISNEVLRQLGSSESSHRADKDARTLRNMIILHSTP